MADLDPVILHRLRTLGIGALRYVVIDPANRMRYIQQIEATFIHSGTRVQVPLLESVRHSIDDASPGEIQEILGSFGIDRGDRCHVLWLNYSSGVSLRYGDFIDHYDDLWFPASDDVYVTNEGISWLVAISHEEAVVFYRSNH